jgi:hypothetical protein
MNLLSALAEGALASRAVVANDLSMEDEATEVTVSWS